MKKTNLLLILVFSVSIALGQTSADSIQLKKVFGGYQAIYQGKRLNMSQLVNTMKPNEIAFKQIKSAQSTYTLATIFAGIGGGLIGYPLGTALGGGDPEWSLAAVGAGFIIVSIPISQKFNKQLKSAVDQYNNGVRTSSIWDKTEVRIAFTGNGVGLKITF